MIAHPEIVESFTTFGPFLRYLRRRARLTQRDLSIAVGYSVSQICLLEKEQRLPDLTTVAALFVPALDVQDEPGLATRLLELAAAVRSAADSEAGTQTSYQAIPVSQISETTDPPLRSPAFQPDTSKLPAATVPLIGRAREVALVRGLLLDPAVRLITLLGPPGVGKTRLALQLAWESTASFADGARWIELAATHDPALVATTVAQALELNDSSKLDVETAIRSYLADKQILLVLDNFEHVMAAAGLIVDLLIAAPNLKILTTSRAALHIYGEHQLTVAPLAMPTLAALPHLNELAQIPSVALFCARAHAIKPSFVLSESNMLAIAAICTKLDGLPLAIELAAAQSKLFTAQELAARLVRGNQPSGRSALRLLTRGPRNAPTRHQTLIGAIDWSYTLLDPAERMLFRRLGVFVGGWTLAAAATVCGQQEPSEEGGWQFEQPASFLDQLAALVDKSLVVQQEHAGVARFSMLETLREYALEQLVTEGEEEETRRRHGHYFLALVERMAPQGYLRLNMPLGRQLDPELENLRAVLRWSLSEADTRTIGLRLVNALGPFWTLRGLLHEGRTWLETVLSYQELPDIWRARALMHLGILLGRLGDYQAAMADLEESLEMLQGLDDRPSTAQTLTHMSAIASLQGNYERAAVLAAESVALFEALNEHEQIVGALFQLGAVAIEQGQADRAAPCLEKCVQIAREIDELGYLAGALNLLGMGELEQGNAQASLARFHEGLVLFQQRDETLNVAWTLRNLGLAELLSGQIDQAAAHFKEALALYHEFGATDGLAIALEGLSGVAAARGQARSSARLLGAAAAIRDSMGLPLSPNSQAIYNRMLEPATAMLDPMSWQVELAYGRTLPLDQALLRAQE